LRESSVIGMPFKEWPNHLNEVTCEQIEGGTGDHS
jgi:hypothetical protein